jgi:hypothetical protein
MQTAPFAPVGPGWHAITHEDLDDEREPRTTWLLQELAGWTPDSRAEAEARLIFLLGLHAGQAAPGSPAVCIHQGGMRTVSSALVWLTPEQAAYSHAEGPPCTTPFADFTHLITEAPRGA